MLRLWLMSLVTIFLAVGMVSCGDKDNESENNNSPNPPNPTSKPILTSQPSDVRKTLEYAPAAIDNPLKGLVPYQGDKRLKIGRAHV